jgi:hypothetical protein
MGKIRIQKLTVDGEGGALSDALAAGGGGGDASPGSAGQESASMMGSPTATTTGTASLARGFQGAAPPALFAARGLSDGGVPAPATTACESALEAIVHASIRSGSCAPAGRREKAAIACGGGVGAEA